MELVPSLADVDLSPELLEALLESAEGGDAISANSALEVLADKELTQAAWRRLCALASSHRVHRLPEIGVAMLVAEGGVTGCLPTVALTAFRDGPEDADDRLAALTALGRFADERVPGWLAAVIETGAATLPALTALNQWLMVYGARLDAPNRQRMERLLLGVAQRHGPAPGDQCDAWVRWAVVDCLCLLSGRSALPYLRSAWHSGGDPVPNWYRAWLARRVALLLGEPNLAAQQPALVAQRLEEEGGELVQLAALPDARARALARSPRIGRRAIEELNQSEGEAGDVSEIIARRAAIEGALVARGQLIASLMFDQGVEQAAEGEAVAVELGPEWTPWSSLLVDSERQVLYAEEDAWISS